MPKKPKKLKNPCESCNQAEAALMTRNLFVCKKCSEKLDGRS